MATEPKRAAIIMRTTKGVVRDLKRIAKARGLSMEAYLRTIVAAAIAADATRAA